MTSVYTYSKTKSLLTIDNVSVSYDGKPIIKGFSAEVLDIVRPGCSQGQIIGLLGPSGIGKTTLFRVIAGLMQPDTGSVTIGDTHKPVVPGDVGVVTQNYLLLAHRKVIDNLIYAGLRAGLKEDAAKKTAMDYLTQFGVAEHANKYPVQLSGGQRQRVAIAQQLICGRSTIIMDEPFSGLDVVALTNARNVITDVASKNEESTFIIVTHDVTSAVAICDTIWLMGRDRDTSGNVIPGARLVEIIDLIEENIAWHENSLDLPQSVSLIRDIKQRFLSL